MKWRTLVLALLTFGTSWGLAQDLAPSWQDRIRAYVSSHQLQAAMQVAEKRLQEAPDDFEAHGWRGRLLAWSGRWSEAETEYRLVLQQYPADTEMLTALADVLAWQGKPQDALQFLNCARQLSPANPEILLRRARVLEQLGQVTEARAQFQEILQTDPTNRDARTALSANTGEFKHELRVGVDIDTFNYTDASEAQTISLASRWNSRWSTVLGTSIYQRFGQDAAKVTASTAFHLGRHDWIGVGGGLGHDNGVIPQHEAGFEYGHGFVFHGGPVHAVEASYQQQWLWYRGAHVLTLNFNQLYYLPKDWTWAFRVTGARSGFSGTGVDWTPSGSTRLAFPLYRRLSGNLGFAAGSENFAEVDQIGSFAARTYSGGLRYRFSSWQDISGYVASQDRSQHRSQNSYGLSYGIHF